jgi:hypothetical protein
VSLTTLSPTEKSESTTSNHTCTSYSIEKRKGFLLIFNCTLRVLALLCNDRYEGYLWHAEKVTILESTMSIQNEVHGSSFDENQLISSSFTVWNVKGPIMKGAEFRAKEPPSLAIRTLLFRTKTKLGQLEIGNMLNSVGHLCKDLSIASYE